jgi:hypothetical protein
MDYEYDIVVAGGGLAGVCAAIAAARNGAKVALLQDRPVLGGNSSNEIRVAVSGASVASGDGKCKYPDRRETGIIEELLLENRMKNAIPTWEIWSEVICDKANSEKNLDIFLNNLVTDVRMASNNRIECAITTEISSGAKNEFRAKFFIDCSGDGHMAYKAGAEFRYGREAKSEFEESLAPDKSDSMTMGASLLFCARDTGHPVKFIPPEDAYVNLDWDRLCARPHDDFSIGYWWMELPDPEDNISNSEQIRKELRRYIYGVWNHIKNSGTHHKSENWAIEWIGAVLGRRESRRFMGDYVLNENDVRDARIFEDTIAYGGWAIDVHNPKGLTDPANPPGKWVDVPEVYGIPWRCIYSRNILNCLFAGRNISVSHVALGSTRIMGTCSILGQAAGTGAAYCLASGILPKDMNPIHISKLQQNLLRDDCFIPGTINKDPYDLARSAVISASSEKHGFEAAKTINGYSRDWKGVCHHWESAGVPAFIELDFGKTETISCIEIKFNSNLDRSLTIRTHPLYQQESWGIPPELVKEYEITACDGTSESRIFHERCNYLRFRRHEFNPFMTRRLRVNIFSAWGASSAQVYEIRAYGVEKK